MTDAVVLEVVRRTIVAVLPHLLPDEIVPAQSLRDDLGANSIDVLDIAAGCADELRLDIPAADLAAAHTVGDLAGVLEASRDAVYGRPSGRR